MDGPPPKSGPRQSQQGGGRRGRPRLATTDGDPAAQRRAQIRLAQQTFRSKNQGLVQTLQRRVEELEKEAYRRNRSFSTFYDVALKSNLHRSEPKLSAMLRQTAELFLFEKQSEVFIEAPQGRVTESEPNCDYSTSSEWSQALSRPFSPLPDSNTIFGFHIPAEYDHSSPIIRVEDHDYPITPRSTTPQDAWIPAPGPRSLQQDYSYSFQESTFGRRLHRLCLEHTYRLFINPGTDPKTVYRVFRLVQCMADTKKMQPYFESLLRRGDNESLELPGLPYYTIGGAGTHYQRKDLQGKMGLPSNTRLPKRILGSVPFQSGTGDQNENYIQFLERLGYGGIWMDSYDVEAYLRNRGVMIDERAAVVSMQPSLGSVTELSTQVELKSLNPQMPKCAPATFSFDIQRFVEYLLKDVVMLGRAPGFRKSGIDLAIDHALRQDFS
ncbi:hypothetical protein DL95DRAFT_526345 [Leptodontidium sp. 2 PMI_412]|nr:hypothetical protein DL95DRAFT_526345 [Leptodontidium sp. 2 PMI_412]